MDSSRIRTFFLVVTALLLTACGGGGDDSPAPAPTPAPTSKPGVLAISALPRLNPLPTTAQQFVTLVTEAFELTYNAGARGQMTTFTWSSLEPTAGNFSSSEFDNLNSAIANAQTRGVVQFIGIQLINTTARELPADLATLAFDDPSVRTRFRALLDRVVTPNAGKIRYLSIGNEVDAYLRAHPTEWPAYKTLYDDAVQYAHTLDPAIKVGVTGTADGALLQSPTELQTLNAMSDVIILTYYPLQFDAQGTVTVRSPTVAASDFPSMLNFAGNKQLVLQEVGYPSAAANGSSEAMQAQFVTNVFAAWRASNGKIPFLNYFVLHDFTQQMCDDFGVYYGLPGNASFKAFLCSLGLRKDDGTPRAAWSVFQNEAAQSNLP